jgi:hypothetical protein
VVGVVEVEPALAVWHLKPPSILPSLKQKGGKSSPASYAKAYGRPTSIVKRIVVVVEKLKFVAWDNLLVAVQVKE